MNNSGNKPARGFAIRRVLTKKGVLAILSILVAVIVALTVLWYSGLHDMWRSTEDRFSLSQVQDGIKCTILKRVGYWEAFSVGIDVGTVGVAWKLDDPNLSRGSWTAAEFDTQHLGDIAVHVVAVDLEGDGNLSTNDYLVVTTVNSTGFTPDVIYVFKLWTGHIAISGVFLEQSFRFEDGKLVTGEQKTTVIPV